VPIESPPELLNFGTARSNDLHISYRANPTNINPENGLVRAMFGQLAGHRGSRQIHWTCMGAIGLAGIGFVLPFLQVAIAIGW
jgi:hypothetical protein